MDREDLLAIREAVPSPCFVVHEGLLEANLQILDRVQKESGAKVLLALKGFACWALFPLVRRYLHGACASGLHEALLAREVLDREVHTYAPAFSDDDLQRILRVTDHLVFNSFSEWERHRTAVQAAPRPISCGLRINPEHSTGAVPLYDPCAPGSRLGIPRRAFSGRSLEGLDGLHFHTLCEQDSHALESTLNAIETGFGDILGSRAWRWVNFGGGHHITRHDYDLDHLLHLVRGFRQRHSCAVYLEPGEAVALEAGVLVATVLDVLENGVPIAILDTSVTCHMPDVLEMPYRPRIEGAGHPGEKPFTYRLGGQSCLAGDILGEYSFDRPLARGDRLVFHDMAHYSMVKTTTFNGVRLPAIASWSRDRGIRVWRRFDYRDYRDRLS